MSEPSLPVERPDVRPLLGSSADAMYGKLSACERADDAPDLELGQAGEHQLARGRSRVSPIGIAGRRFGPEEQPADLARIPEVLADPIHRADTAVGAPQR